MEQKIKRVNEQKDATNKKNLGSHREPMEKKEWNCNWYHFVGSFVFRQPRALNAQVMFILMRNECWWILISHTCTLIRSGACVFFSGRLVLRWHLTGSCSFYFFYCFSIELICIHISMSLLSNGLLISVNLNSRHFCISSLQRKKYRQRWIHRNGYEVKACINYRFETATKLPSTWSNQYNFRGKLPFIVSNATNVTALSFPCAQEIAVNSGWGCQRVGKSMVAKLFKSCINNFVTWEINRRRKLTQIEIIPLFNGHLMSRPDIVSFLVALINVCM